MAEGANKAVMKIRRGRNYAGKLAQLKDMPLDIFLELIAYLTPLDLLHLSWVSKHLRMLVMSKSWRHLWATARRNSHQLPDPHSGLSEPKYAALMFHHGCPACGAKRAGKCDYALAVRFCGRCWKQNVVKGSTLIKHYNLSMWDTTLYTLLPCEGADDISNSHRCYYAPEFDRVAREYTDPARWGDAQAKQAYVQQRQEYVAEVKEFCRNLQAWKNSEKLKQCEIMDTRQESIKQKLVELGYDPLEFPPANYWCNKEWHAILRQPRELTPQIWKRIQPKLVKILDEKIARTERSRLQAQLLFQARKELRVKELRTVYQHFLPTAPTEDGPFPTFEEMSCISDVKALLEGNDAWRTVTKERLLTVLPALRERARQNRAEFAQVMWDHIVKRSPPPSLPLSEPLLSTELGGESYGDLAPSPPRTNVDVETLEGVPRGMQYGSEDILGLATALFQCHLCKSIGSQPVYNIVELTSHLHQKHAGNLQRWQRVCVDDVLARKVLETLGLSEHTRYEDVSGRAVCTCLCLEPGATFAELLSHIAWEAMFDDHVMECKWASLLPDATYIPDHDLENNVQPVVMMLADGETREKPALTGAEQITLQVLSQTFPTEKVVCKMCYRCTTIVDVEAYWHHSHLSHEDFSILTPREMELEELIFHVRAKHAMEAIPDDAHCLH